MWNYVFAGIILTITPVLMQVIDPSFQPWWFKPAALLGVFVLIVCASVSVGRWWVSRKNGNA